MKMRPFTPIIIIGCSIAFICDTTIDFGSAFGVLYVPLLFLRLTMQRPPSTYALLIIVVILTIAGFFLPNISSNVSEALFDRFMTVLAAILTAVLIEQKIKARQSLNISLANEARLKLKAELMENEIKIARSLQESILPRQFPEMHGVTGHGIMIPAKDVGGDFFDFIRIDDNHIGLAVGDVTGKGVPAAFFMAIVRTLLRTISLLNLPPSECLARLNDQIAAENEQEMFGTIFYGIIDTKTGEFLYANGGHNNPALITQNGELEWLPETGGVLIGMISGIKYTEKKIQLCRGDNLFFYTDGVVEAFNQDNVEFSEDRLAKVLRECRNISTSRLTEAVYSAVKAFENGAPQADDITCVALRYGEA